MSLLAAAVEDHTQGPQKTDRHGDGCDGQHLSLVPLFALCREATMEVTLNISSIFEPSHISATDYTGQKRDQRCGFIPSSVRINVPKSHPDSTVNNSKS